MTARSEESWERAAFVDYTARDIPLTRWDCARDRKVLRLAIDDEYQRRFSIDELVRTSGANRAYHLHRDTSRFRLCGQLSPDRPDAGNAAKSTPWVWATLSVLLVSGILLTITEPARELLNWVFRVKMLLVLLLAGILLLVQSRLRRNPEYWTQSPGRRAASRAVGALAVVVGACIVTAGRWIAYV